MTVLLDSKPVTGFESSKVRALLAYLAAEQGHPHTRESLAELLWPNQAAGAALANLRHVLANLRRVLDDHRASPHSLLITAETLQFNAGADAVVDLARFDALTSPKSISSATEAACREAVALYRGPFLQGFTLDDCPAFAEWMAIMREQVDRHLVQILARLVGDSLQHGDFVEAVEWTRYQVAVEPWNEEAHCQLMALLALSGQRAAALHQFDLCRRLLAEELDVEPQPETLALVEQIRLGRVDETVLRGATLIRHQNAPPPPAAHNLPAQHTPFFGRNAELVRIATELADPHCRLLTLVGPGGVGKTRLAVEVTAGLDGSFPDGIWFVPLHTTKEESWLPAIVQALQIPAQSSARPWQQIVDFLQGKSLLLILDNFEHLVEQAGRITELLETAPQLKILVTSRVRLNISPEWLIPLEGLEVPPLEVPMTAAAGEEWQAVEGYSALQLFLHNIRRLKPAFTPTAADARVAVRICQLLSGIPLAIELAAAWVRILELPVILAQLEQSLDLLATTLRDIPERHRSMRAVFDHSWRLLTPREQSLMRQMAVFRGGCTAAAANAVTGASLAELSELVDQSWLRVSPLGRYDLHELVRQYAEKRLLEEHERVDGEAVAEVHRRHCAFFVSLLHAREGVINRHAAVMADFMVDYANLLAAWQWTIEQGEMGDALDMVLAFYFVGDMLGTFHFTLQQFESAIRSLLPYVNTESQNAEKQQRAGAVLGWLYYTRAWHFIYLGLLEQAQAENARNFALQSGLPPSNDQNEQLLAIDWINAWLTYYGGHFSEARRRFRIALRGFRTAQLDFTLYGQTAGSIFWQAHAEAALGWMAWVAGRYHVAELRMLKALALRDQIGEQRFRAYNLGTLARIYLTTGDYSQAREVACKGLYLSDTFGDQIGIAFGHLALGRVEAAVANWTLAQAHFQQSEAAGRESGHHRLLVESLVELGRVELALGHSQNAKSRFDEAMKSFASLGTAHSNSLTGVVLGLGWAALGLHDFSVAQRMFAQVPTMTGCLAWEVMDAMTGLAEVYSAAGGTTQAAKLLSQVLASPVTSYATRTHANQLVEGLTLSPPSPSLLRR